MKKNPLIELQTYGQSIWLDFIRREMISSGELRRLIEEDGLRGVTSNPSIFEKAIAGTSDYEDAIRGLALDGKESIEIYETLTVEDVGSAADLFRPVYEQTAGRDGFVSLEVSPRLAHDTGGTIAEARRLWEKLARPNVLIKVPGTLEGLPAIEQLIGDGINVNVTLLFGLPRYRQVADAYISGLEARARQGKAVDRIASVASFFLSRIDVLVDPMLENIERAGDARSGSAASLRGRTAIASAKAAYRIYREMFGGKRYRKLAGRGACTQRLLWASTGTKNPAYSDVKYVEALVGLDTVNTLPLETLDAYRDHGRPAANLAKEMDEACEALDHLSEVGVNLDSVTEQLERAGVEAFIKPYDSLLARLAEKRAAHIG